MAFLTMTTMNSQNNMEQKEIKTVDLSVWPKGEFNADYAQYFTGNSYLATLAGGLLNVTFEPGCRNNWHPMLVIPVPIVIAVTAVQLLNASAPIVVTLFGIVIDVRPVQ